MRKFFALTAASLMLLSSSVSAIAGDVEKTLYHDLNECRQTVRRMIPRGNSTSSADFDNLSAVILNLRADRLLLGERQAAISDRSTSLGSQARARREAVSTKLLQQIDDLLDRLSAIGLASTPSDLDSLNQILESLIPQKSRPLLGSLPYRHTNYPAREPTVAPVIKPAYKGGDRTVLAADTAASPEAPITREIAELAQSLQWSPVLIYEWVKNNVNTEWYWGSMKGASETLRQRSGNDADQATLLVSLLRAANFPARYIKGTVEFFPDLEIAKNLTGLDDPLKIASFLQKAGIPFQPVIAGGGISNFQIGHIWVETFIPYSNYRGAVIDDQGKIWLGLDTSIKPQGYIRTQGAGVPADILSPLRDDYLNAAQTLIPLDYLKGKLDDSLALSQPGKTWNDLKDTAVIIPDILKIIPSSLQFNQIAVTGEYQTLPDELKHKIVFTAASGTDELFSATLHASMVAGKRLALRYEPETVEDQNTIDSFGGLDNTPPYLVRLRPVLTIDGERVVVGQDGLPMGADYTLNLDVVTPNGSERITSSQIAGNLSVIGIVSQKAPTPEAISDTDDAETILFKEAIGYLDRWNSAEDDLAALLGQRLSRPTVTVATVGNQLAVTTLLDVPHDMEWRGVYLDAGYKRTETIGRNGQEKEFMQLSALQGSILENRIFEDDFKVDSVSTAKLLQLAKAGAIPFVTIDRSNIVAVLPQLPFDAAVTQDIADAVNQGLVVTIPVTEITYRDWSGIGYLKENPETGESGWMLSGQIAGGMTAVAKEQWVNQDLANAISAPNNPRPNINPEKVRTIVRITAADYQDGVAGKSLVRPFMVMALDDTGRPVVNVPIVFRSIAGGGLLAGDAAAAPGSGASEYRTVTGATGIAKVYVTLGRQTSNSPYYIQQNLTYAIQAGLNLVDARATAAGGVIALDKPFEAYGFPGDAVKMVKVAEEATINKMWFPGLFAGSAWVQVTDEYDNPVSNKQVTFFVKPQINHAASSPFETADAKIQNAKLLPLDSNCPGTPSLECNQCAEQLSVTSSIAGSSALVILGNTKETDYFVEARALKEESGKETMVAINPVTFTYRSSGMPGQNDSASTTYLSSNAIYHIDSRGNRIDAGKAGSPIAHPLTVTLYRLEEAAVSAEKSNCSANCYYLKGTGIFQVSRVDDGTVRFGATGTGSVSPAVVLGTAEAPMVNGMYQTRLTLSGAPGLNTITADCSASVPVKQIDTSSGEISTSSKTLTAQTSLDIWGVLPQLEPNLWILINSKGFPTNDIPLNFSVNPADYPVGTMSVRFFEDNQYMGDVPVQRTGDVLSTGGAVFKPNATYSARLSLFDAAIESDPVKVTIAAVDLAIDSSNKIGVNPDGTHKDPEPNAQDESIEDTPGLTGKLIPINDRDRNGDGVPDFADGYDLADPPQPANNASAAFVPIILNIPESINTATARIRFYYNASNPAVVSNVDGIYLPDPGGHIRIWNKDGGNGRLKVSAVAGGNYIKPGDTLSVTQFGTPVEPRKWRLYVEGVAPSSQAGEELIRIDIDPDGDGPAPFMVADEVRVTVNKPLLVTDFNHDRTIDDTDKLRAALGNTFYFWVNDDKDVAGEDISVNNIPQSGSNGTDDIVNGMSDLEDFFPVHLNLKGLIAQYSLSKYYFVLKNEDAALNLVFTKMSRESSGKYLTDAGGTSRELSTKKTYPITKNGVVLNEHPDDPTFLQRITTGENFGVILVEGRKATTKPLVLEVIEQNSRNTVFTSSLNISIDGVEQMFRHINLTQSIDKPGAPAIETGNLGEHKAKGGEKSRVDSSGFANQDHFDGFDKTCNDKYVVMIHGANVNGQDARGWHAEMFKRLYWTGSKAKFVGVTWYSDAGLSWEYYPKAIDAFASAAKLGSALKGAVGTAAPVTIMAHSLGNMLTSIYLVDYYKKVEPTEHPNISGYMMLNAAVTLEAYLGDYTGYAEGKEKLTQPFDSGIASNDMVHSSWIGYEKRFGASEWHQLFDDSDGRSKLTWRNRFANLPTGINYVNFHSKGEDVLASYAGDSLLGSLLSSWSVTRNAWVFQEKWKGLPLGLAGSKYMGWGFNFTADYNKTPIVTNPDGTASGGEFFTAAQASSSITDNSRLYSKPLFRKEVPSGDLFRDELLSLDEIKPVLNELLIYAIPALTTASGGAAGDKFEEHIPGFFTIDMNGSIGEWPSGRPRKEWLHSDVKDVGYPFVYSTINKLVVNGGLQ